MAGRTVMVLLRYVAVPWPLAVNVQSRRLLKRRQERKCENCGYWESHDRINVARAGTGTAGAPRISSHGKGIRHMSVLYRLRRIHRLGVPSLTATVRGLLRRNTARLAALSLLLVAGLDLAFPSLCQAESALPAAAHSEDAALEHRQPEPVAPVQGPEEDCFCCCVHIRPQPVTRGIESLAKVGDRLMPGQSLEPELRAQALFHPPRQ